MAGPLFYDRVMETTTTTGTGALTLAGAVSGFQSFAVVGDGNTCFYCLYAVNGDGDPSGVWECGLGTYATAGTTLTRTTVYSNSSGGSSALNLGSGRKRVILTPVARFFGGSGAVFTANCPVYSDGTSLLSSAALTYAASGTHLTATAQAATDVPLAVKMAASHTADALDVLDSSGNARGGMGPQSVLTDSLAWFLKPSNRTFYMGTNESAGAWQWGTTSGNGKLQFIPANPFFTTATISFEGADTTGVLLRGSSQTTTISLIAREDGGSTKVDFNRRPSDDSSAVGGTARCWTKTGQTDNALEVLAPGGASAAWAVRANGGLMPASLADSAAANNTVYYSTTAGKLVYKDSGGVVNNLY